MTKKWAKYQWGEGNEMNGKLDEKWVNWEKGSEEEFIADNCWAYRR